MIYSTFIGDLCATFGISPSFILKDITKQSTGGHICLNEADAVLDLAIQNKQEKLPRATN